MRRVPPAVTRAIVAVAALLGALASGFVGVQASSQHAGDGAAVLLSPPAKVEAAPKKPSRFEVRLPAVVKRLDATRRHNRWKLSRGDSARGQSRAARRLSRAYARAASRLGHPKPAAAAELVRVLRRTQSAYARLADAAWHRSAKRYGRASVGADRLERRLRSALRRAAKACFSDSCG
jgi:hypothetical protein